MGFIPGMQSQFNIQRSTNIIYPIHRIKDKKQSPQTQRKKTFDKLQHLLILKNTQQTRIEKNFLTLQRASMKTPQLVSYLIVKI